MPKHSNLSVFLPHVGCPHRCSFCDQRAISETTRVPSPAEVGDALRRAARQLKNPPEDCEAAFFGGSFTALEPAYQEALLREARAVVTEYHLKGIRLSTRPDAVDDAVCQRFLSFGVTSVELGAQSMDDGVLLQNGRGHTAAQSNRLRLENVHQVHNPQGQFLHIPAAHRQSSLIAHFRRLKSRPSFHAAVFCRHSM